MSDGEWGREEVQRKFMEKKEAPAGFVSVPRAEWP